MVVVSEEEDTISHISANRRRNVRMNVEKSSYFLNVVLPTSSAMCPEYIFNIKFGKSDNARTFCNSVMDAEAL